MRGTAHERSALAQFQNGEERLVYARHKAAPGGPLYYLHDGTAAEIRTWAKEHLECFMPTCDARELTTVARSTRRDGFSHRRGAGGHAKEGLFHQQAKALISRWVKEKYAGAVVAQPEQATRSKERRADVMLTWPDGRQVAIEVQYAPLTVAQWKARHESYTEQGLTCVWLLGHIPPHLREARNVRCTSRGSAGAVAFGALHQAMLAAQVPLFWINPIEEQVGTVWIDTDAHECEETFCDWPSDDRMFQIPPQERAESLHSFGFFGIDVLAECEITPDGMQTPTTRRLRAEHAEYLTARKADFDAQAGIREERQRREAQARHEADARQRVAAARIERLLEEDRNVREFLAKYANALDGRWKLSGTYARIIAEHGFVPAVLSTELPNDIGVRGHATHWHALIYEAHILGRPDGQKFTVADCYRTLSRNGFTLHSDGLRRSSAVIDYLKHLAESDLLYVKMSRPRPGQIEYARVYGDCNTATENKRLRDVAKAEREAQQAEREQRSAERQAEIRRRREALALKERQAAREVNRGTTALPTPSPTPKVSSSAPHTETGAVKYTNCLTCGMSLADVLMKRGYHFGCEPRR